MPTHTSVHTHQTALAQHSYNMSTHMLVHTHQTALALHSLQRLQVGDHVRGGHKGEVAALEQQIGGLQAHTHHIMGEEVREPNPFVDLS